MAGIKEQEHTVYVIDAVTETKPTEQLLERYLQTQSTIAFFEKMIVSPFENFIKDRGIEQVFEEDGVLIKVTETVKDKNHTAKDIWTLTDSLFRGSIHNQGNGKQMYGVKQFGDVVTIDTGYVGESIRDWQDVVIGSTTSQRVSLAGKAGIAAMVQNYTPQLGVVNEKSMDSLGYDTVGLYVAAKQQVAALKKAVMVPVEKMIKGAAAFDPKQTTWDVHAYGDMLTQIQAVPSPKHDYSGVMDKFVRSIKGYESREENGFTTFLNQDLAQPRIYTSIPLLQKRSSQLQAKAEILERKELFMGYQPDVARVLTKV